MVVIVLLALSACADRYVLPDLPQPSEAPQYYKPVIEDSYRIQIGDKLLIQSYYDTQLNQAPVVRPDGYISLVLVGELVAVNKKPAQLSGEIKEAYALYLDNPDINVVINEVAPRRVYIGGEVNTPSVHSIEGSLTLMQGITLVRGFVNTANTKQVLLLRQGDNGLEVHQIDTDRILTNTIPDVFLAQNDVVFVPRTHIADLNLFVEQYLSRMVPEFLRINFGFNYQLIDNLDTETTTTILTP